MWNKLKSDKVQNNGIWKGSEQVMLKDSVPES